HGIGKQTFGLPDRSADRVSPPNDPSGVRGTSLLGRLSIVASVFGVISAIAILIAILRAEGNRLVGDAPLELPAVRVPAIPIADHQVADRESSKSSPADQANGIVEQASLSDDNGQIADSSDGLADVREMASELLRHENLTREQLEGFASLLNQLASERSAFELSDVFWVGETWEKLGGRASTTMLESKCYWLAASAYALAKEMNGISPDDLRKSTIRQQDLSLKSTKLRSASERIASEPGRSKNSVKE
ncbi:MAG: hypothetical protein AAGJ83_04825, partial [Planctomycetota bacterium]